VCVCVCVCVCALCLSCPRRLHTHPHCMAAVPARLQDIMGWPLDVAPTDATLLSRLIPSDSVRPCSNHTHSLTRSLAHSLSLVQKDVSLLLVKKDEEDVHAGSVLDFFGADPHNFNYLPSVASSQVTTHSVDPSPWLRTSSAFSLHHSPTHALSHSLTLTLSLSLLSLLCTVSLQ
jgi:hypothetical protein